MNVGKINKSTDYTQQVKAQLSGYQDVSKLTATADKNYIYVDNDGDGKWDNLMLKEFIDNVQNDGFVPNKDKAVKYLLQADWADNAGEKNLYEMFLGKAFGQGAKYEDLTKYLENKDEKLTAHNLAKQYFSKFENYNEDTFKTYIDKNRTHIDMDNDGIIDAKLKHKDLAKISNPEYKIDFEKTLNIEKRTLRNYNLGFKSEVDISMNNLMKIGAPLSSTNFEGVLKNNDNNEMDEPSEGKSSVTEAQSIETLEYGDGEVTKASAFTNLEKEKDDVVAQAVTPATTNTPITKEMPTSAKAITPPVFVISAKNQKVIEPTNEQIIESKNGSIIKIGTPAYNDSMKKADAKSEEAKQAKLRAIAQYAKSKGVPENRNTTVISQGKVPEEKSWFSKLVDKLL